MSVASGVIAIGNPGNRLSRGISPSVAVAVSGKRVAFTGTRGDSIGCGRRSTFFNLCHSLIGGVIINIDRKCGGALRVINIKCHITGRNGILRFSLNCDRPVFLRLPTRIGIRAGSRHGRGPLIVLRYTSGRLLKRVYTGVHSFHGPRPCGNGNVHFRKRVVHEGSNGSTSTGW